MRPDGPVKDLTESQKIMARTAGVPANRVGLGAEYPKMVFRPGDNPRHQLENKPLKIGNGPEASPDRLSPGYDCEIAYVDSAEDEAQALAGGWFLSPDPVEQKRAEAQRIADQAKDARIAELEAQLADQPEKRGPGRPPKAQ